MRQSKLTMSNEELVRLYSTKKNREICAILGVKMPTLMSYLKKAKKTINFELKGSGNRQPKAKVIIKD